jgi:tRNA 2-thiouridine synthesizing protein A
MGRFYHYELDASGLLCPHPLLRAKKKLERLKPGDILRVISTDPSSVLDFKVFAETSGNALLEVEENAGKYVMFIRKRLDFERYKV